MKLNHLFGAVAACGLIGGAAHAQSAGATGAASDNTQAGGSTTASQPASGAGSDMGTSTETSGMGTSGAAGGSTSGSMSGSTSSGVGANTSSGAGAGMSAAAPPVSATSATAYGQGASVTVATTTNGPIPDTPENRQKYGGPMSRAGKHTAAKGN